MTLSPQELSDRLEIQDLLVDYSHAIDTRDWDALDDVFTPDAFIDYSAFGGSTGDLATTGNGGYGLKVMREGQGTICGNQVGDNRDGATNASGVAPSLPCRA